ncbi:MAG: hypothetical protein RJA70_2734, partial [Pseudomonadota bacterium]
MRQALAGPDYFSTGDGHSGALTVAVGQSVTVNSYTGLAADVAVAAADIIVDDAAAFQTGDLVLLWQAAGLADPGTPTERNTVNIAASNVGRFEFTRVVSKNNSTDRIVLLDPLTQAFSAASSQVVRVPEYASVTIAATGRIVATPWNGDIGGIAVFLVNGVLANNGAIDVIGAGFRGGIQKGNSAITGCSMLNPVSNSAAELAKVAQKGEGIVSSRYNNNARARSNVVNGGGGGVCHNSGGGGGGHAGAGGKGGRTWRVDPDPAIPGKGTGRDVGGFGGVGLTYNAEQRMILGGGGGAGQQNNNIGGTGAAGGGVIFVRAGSVTGTGKFLADGANGKPSTGKGNDAAGAAGAGGSVVVRSADGLACTTASANGGIGGSVNFQDHGPGGGGGGGYVLFQSQTAVCARVVTGGAPGTQTDKGDFAGPSYGATAGGAGTATLISSSFPTDSDLDGIPDLAEGATDTDGDGVPNFSDADDDNDGLLTSVETDTDADRDGIANHQDKDSDNDGIPDVVEAGAIDGGNGVLAGFSDANGNGVDDTLAGSPITPPNTDNSGPPDYLDLDSDGDGLPDAQEVGLDTDPSGQVLGFIDANGDGLLDDYPTVQLNTDSTGAPDFLGTDSDGDGLLDGLEAFDTDGDGTQNLIAIGHDHDSDGIDDQFDGNCPSGGGCMGGGNTVNLNNLTAAQDADRNGTGDWLEVCVDGYVTGMEVCDDGDNDNDNECSNSCLWSLGGACGMNGECATMFCDRNVCSACVDDVSGGTDSGCALGAAICRDNGGLSTCTTCADTMAGIGVDEGCSVGAPQCDELASGGYGSCIVVDVCVPAGSGVDDSDCNGRDDDCDGEIDEDFVVRSSDCGLGVCGGAGQVQCVAGQQFETCEPAPAGTGCEDGNACTLGDSCDGTGACDAGVASVADDGNPCTADSCDPLAGVIHTAVSAGTACGDTDVCNGEEACDGAGACAAGVALVVDDGNPCTADSCNPLAGVIHTAVSAGTSCGDFNACNGEEACDGAGA